MNPYRDADMNSFSFENAPASSDGLNPYGSDPSSLIRTGHSSLTASLQNPPLPPADVQSSSSSLPLPDFSPSPGHQATLTPVPSSVCPSAENPYPPPSPLRPPRVVVPPSDLQPSLTSQCSEESCPDLECSICFSQFNNVFRCPKMLHCKHTFCLECLARINVKSPEPSAIQCPLCRGLTPLPTLGLPKLTTDSDVLSCLPAAMQRVYSIRFSRNKGKLQVKRATDGPAWLTRRSLTSLDVGLPSRTASGGGTSGSFGNSLFRLTGRPVCRAFLLTSVVMMMVLLTGIVIYLLTKGSN